MIKIEAINVIINRRPADSPMSIHPMPLISKELTILSIEVVVIELVRKK
jgi:hypothetical protein